MTNSFLNQTEADRFYIQEAFRERENSDDPKAKVVPQSGVGVIIANLHGEIARSANVLPPALATSFMETKQLVAHDDRYHVIEHAERAAIYKALLDGKDLNSATIYCTRFPCSDCARAILWSGIKRAVFPGGFAGENRWIEAQRAALRILRAGGVRVRYLKER